MRGPLQTPYELRNRAAQLPVHIRVYSTGSMDRLGNGLETLQRRPGDTAVFGYVPEENEP